MTDPPPAQLHPHRCVCVGLRTADDAGLCARLTAIAGVWGEGVSERCMHMRSWHPTSCTHPRRPPWKSVGRLRDCDQRLSRTLDGTIGGWVPLLRHVESGLDAGDASLGTARRSEEGKWRVGAGETAAGITQ